MQLINKAKEGKFQSFIAWNYILIQKNVYFKGNHIPDQLPPSLLPFKVRHSSIPNTANINGGHTGINNNFSLVNETKVRIKCLLA